MFAKFQRREIMRCMVKLNDLEEMVEPPLGGTSGDLTLAPPQEEAMDLDGVAGRMTETNDKAKLSPGEENFGLV